MKIVYDDLFEFSEIAIRCKIDEPENRHIQCGELDHPTEKGGVE